MGEKTTKLRAEVEVKGADKGAKDLKGVADAQEQVTGKVTSSVQETARAAIRNGDRMVGLMGG